MKVMFITDLHGSTLVLRKALALCTQVDVDVLMIGGDLSGKRLLTIRPIANKKYRIEEPSNQKDDSGTSVEAPLFFDIAGEDLKQHCSRLEDKGYYWRITEIEEIQRLNEDREELRRLFEGAICGRIEKWAKMVTALLPAGVSCLWTGGNDDEQGILDALKGRDLGRFEYVEEKIVCVDDYEIMSLGYSNITPFETGREPDERELSARLEKLGNSAKTAERLIMNVHVPPINCGTLDSVVMRDSGSLVNVGSSAVRDFILNTQPLADFAGHVHEGQGVATIGRTLVFNPGSDYSSGCLQAFVATMAEAKIVDYAHFFR